MKKSRRFLDCAAVTLIAVSTTALAQGKLDSATLKTFGGSYFADCANRSGPRATVFADALVFIDGNKRIAGSNVQAAASFYGREPPPEYRVALLSEVPGGRQFIFVVNEDRFGYYINFDGEPKVLTAIGKPLLAQKFRRCDRAGESPRAAPEAAPAAARSYTLLEVSAAGLLQGPASKAAYYKALGPKAREQWLAKLDGPSPMNRKVVIGATEYVLASACKNHDCADYNTVLLYSAAQGVVYGKIYERGKTTFIGSPSPALARELDKLWRSEWRQGR